MPRNYHREIKFWPRAVIARCMSMYNGFFLLGERCDVYRGCEC